MATSVDGSSHRYDNQMMTANQRSKIIIAGTVGGACSILTAGLVFCMLVCRRWIHDKQRSARRRQSTRRIRTPSTMSSGRGTSASSSSYHITTTYAAARRPSSPVTAPPDDLSLPLPPDARRRSTSVPSRDLPLWWCRPSGKTVASDRPTVDGGSSQFPSCGTPFVDSPFFSLSSTSTNCDVSQRIGQFDSLSSPGGAFPLATDATDDEPGCGGSRCDRRATLSSASSSRPPAAPGRGTAADGIAWTGACARPSSTAASRQPETGARLVVWNERRVSDRKHSDSGLQQRANAATFQRDRNTWELVGCVQSKRDAPEQQQQQRQTEFGGATAFPVNPPIVGRMDWDDCRDADLVWIRRTPKMTRGHMPPSVLTAVLSRQHADDERGHRGCDGQQQDHVAIHRDIMSTRSHGLQRRQ